MKVKSYRFAAVAAVLLALCLVFVAPVGAEEYTSITSVADLQGFAADVNAGNTYYGKTVTLTADLDLLSVVDWEPIGNGTRSNSAHSGNNFSGTFDGAGHTISNLKITSGESSDAIGLFGVVNGGTVKDLVLSNVLISVSSCKNAGGAIGLMVNGATADKITVSGSISALDGAGGIVGRMTISGTIKDCINTASVSAGTGAGAGGIVGKAYYTAVDKSMTISNCINTGAVTSIYAAGGIAGLSAANVNGCMNTGDISAGTEAGGIIGEQVNYGTITENSNSGKISNTDGSSGTAYGGIIGWVRYQTSESDYGRTELITVTGNTNTGTVSASGCILGAGGIVGTIYNQATVSNNINTASVSGGVFAAGIAGGLQFSDDNKKLENGKIAVTGNYVEIQESDVTANCVGLFGYVNDKGTATDVSNNYEKGNVTSNTIITSPLVGGSMTVSQTSAYNGQIVTISDISAEEGYEFESLTVTSVNLVKVGDKYLFMMPNKAVTITSVFTSTDMVANPEISAENVGFDSVKVGYSQPDAKAVTVENTGDVPVTITDVSVSEKYSVGALPAIIQPGQSATFTIQPVAGLAVGNYEETITITTNEGAETTFKVSFLVYQPSSGGSNKPVEEPEEPVVEPEVPTEEPVAGEPTVETEVTDGGEVELETPTAGGSAAADEDEAKITGVVLPTGTDSEVTFVPVSEQAAPEGKETQTKKVFEINVPTYEKGKAAVIKFQMTVEELAADGKEAADVALWHFDEETGEWTKLVTSYTIVDGIVYFEAITNDFSPFAIIYEDEPVDEPVDEPETPASPAPVLGLITALGAAVLLRRK